MAYALVTLCTPIPLMSLCLVWYHCYFGQRHETGEEQALLSEKGYFPGTEPSTRIKIQDGVSGILIANANATVSIRNKDGDR